MQRKNYILTMKSLSRRASGSILTSGKLFFIKKVPSRQARGFAMIMAIIVMIVIATISMFTLMQTGQSVKRTADLYLYEQAELHTKSAIEYALFKIAKEGCQNSLDLQLPNSNPIYDINITMRYSYDGTGTCDTFATVTTPEQNGSVLMDIAVNVSSANTGCDPIRYFRRTIQKL